MSLRVSMPFRPFSAICLLATFSVLVGTAASATAQTGFFHVESVGDRAGVVDPDGLPFTIAAVDHVRPASWNDRTLGFDVYARFVETNYPSREAWVDETISRLQEWGFNTLANHCDEPMLRHRGLAHTVTLYLGGMFARWNGGDPDRWITPWRGPCTGLPNVFHPDFERSVRERVRELCEPERGNPWLLGWFLDNELKWWGPDTARKDLTLFDAIRALSPAHTARQELERWLHSRRQEPQAPIGNEEREAFLRHFAERYFSVLCGAIREVDPDHMILGCRFVEPASSVHPALWEVCGKYCDIVSFNCYPWADLDRGIVLDTKGGRPVAELFTDIHGWCGRPLMVTEWSFPALDAGRPCLYGAGQRMHTQAQRAKASGLFLKTMLALPFMAGNSYFMFLDQPASGISDTFREDSNYGLVSEYGVPYAELTDAFRSIYGELDRYREAPVPGLDAPPPAPGPSERDRYLAAAARLSRVVAASASISSLSNDFVRVSFAAPGTERLASELVFGGETVGSLGALLSWRGQNGNVWTPVSLQAGSAAPEVRVDPATGIATATLRGESDAVSGARFAITVRLTLAPGARSLLAEVISIENLGSDPLAMTSVFLMPYPAWSDAVAVPVPPFVWGAPAAAWWHLPGGGAWGASSHDPAAAFRFWFRPKDKTFHPDAKFSCGPESVPLPPGAAWSPATPMGATIGLKPQP